MIYKTLHRKLKIEQHEQCARRVSGITITSYVQDRKIGKPNNLNVCGAIQPKVLNGIAEIKLNCRSRKSKIPNM
jgi:hypothetical protein